MVAEDDNGEEKEVEREGLRKNENRMWDENEENQDWSKMAHATGYMTVESTTLKKKLFFQPFFLIINKRRYQTKGEGRRVKRGKRLPSNDLNFSNARKRGRGYFWPKKFFSLKRYALFTWCVKSATGRMKIISLISRTRSLSGIQLIELEKNRIEFFFFLIKKKEA